MLGFLLIFLVPSLVQGTLFEFFFDDPKLFSKCQEKPEDYLPFESLFDTSEFIRVMNTNDIVALSGNMTVLDWKIHPTDRVEFHISVYHWEMGLWQPTVFNVISRDFCTEMYDPNKIWYSSWTTYITNVDEVKDKCINVPGTKLILEPFDSKFNLNVLGPKLTGRFKVEYIFKAFDNLNNQRPYTICLMSTGEVFKV